MARKKEQIAAEISKLIIYCLVLLVDTKFKKYIIIW